AYLHSPERLQCQCPTLGSIRFTKKYLNPRCQSSIPTTTCGIIQRSPAAAIFWTNCSPTSARVTTWLPPCSWNAHRCIAQPALTLCDPSAKQNSCRESLQ